MGLHDKNSYDYARSVCEPAFISACKSKFGNDIKEIRSSSITEDMRYGFDVEIILKSDPNKKYLIDAKCVTEKTRNSYWSKGPEHSNYSISKTSLDRTNIDRYVFEEYDLNTLKPTGHFMSIPADYAKNNLEKRDFEKYRLINVKTILNCPNLKII